VKIAFLHYHLKPGGVTSVIRQQAQALKNDAQCLVVSGETAPPDFPCPVACLPGIGYTNERPNHPSAEQVADQIRQILHRHFAGPCDLLHIHNPILAKNHRFLDIINDLHQSGLTVFLQVHDFAEDGRPGAYYFDVPYPRNCHYGVLNSRDYRILIDAGLVPEGLHYLPNGVMPLDVPPFVGSKSFHLYPVRAIRRKNIGEAILLALFLPAEEAIYITQPPNSQVDFPSYHHWQSYVRQHQLPVRFEMGLGCHFPTLVASSKQVLTTSITEGFGFAFLEPWTAGKRLAGRLLPPICRDFSDRGIRLDHLYDAIELPMDWIGKERICDRFDGCLQKMGHVYGVLWPDAWTSACRHALRRKDTIDFGLLDESLQQAFLDRLRQERACREEAIRLNPLLGTAFRFPNPSALIRHNRERVLSQYHPARYRERLIAIYTRVIDTPVQQSIDKEALLAGFLNLPNFSLLKWSDYHG
jgi:hypothetical protein